MSHIHAEGKAIINARPEKVYAILADYKDGHPHILPKKYFGDLTIERGGKGAGTIFNTIVTSLGKQITYRMEVSEPEPGRVLVEKDTASDLVTTFAVKPLDNGTRAEAKIMMDWSAKPGLKGFFEKLLMLLGLRQVFAAELKQLNEFAAKYQPSKASALEVF